MRKTVVVFRSRDAASPGMSDPTVVELSTTAGTQLSIHDAWARVSDPSLPMAGDEKTLVQGGWLPGHSPRPGALTYCIRKGPGDRLAGSFQQVVVWEPPTRLVLRDLTSSDQAVSEVEWTLWERPVEVSVRCTLRVHVLVPAADGVLNRLRVEVEERVAEMARKLPPSLI